ncbi:MAG TPA: M23 family metallopeptidase [Pseudogracilibacillus sp.]|nr:M23 family metallopeptidase [Pseudogracilibacillus sp.]
MDRKINEIRKSIKNRKSLQKKAQAMTKEESLYEMITDEERQGAYHELSHLEQKEHKRHEKSTPRLFFYQLFAAVGLFFLSALLIKSDLASFNKAEHLLRGAFQENFPFATVHEWYVQHLGIPLSLVPEARTASTVQEGYQMPLEGEVVESFTSTGKGIEILPKEDSSVRAVDKGIVIFAGRVNETDKTVVIQHGDRSETTYGKLTSIDVHLYEVVNVHDVIGRVDPAETEESFFFSIEKQSGYVDPIKVINVDG